MAKFFVGASGFLLTTSAKTIVKVIGASAKRFEVVDVAGTGSGASGPLDTENQVQAAYLSNAGAGTPGASPTPEKMDQASNASQLTAGTSYSVEPTTYNANTFPLFAHNGRGGMAWRVPQGEGFKTDGGQTALSFGVRVLSNPTGGVEDGEVMWWEP